MIWLRRIIIITFELPSSNKGRPICYNKVRTIHNRLCVWQNEKERKRMRRHLSHFYSVRNKTKKKCFSSLRYVGRWLYIVLCLPFPSIFYVIPYAWHCDYRFLHSNVDDCVSTIRLLLKPEPNKSEDEMENILTFNGTGTEWLGLVHI